MKKILLNCYVVLFLLALSFLPICGIYAKLNNYALALDNSTVFLIIIIALSLGYAIFSWVVKPELGIFGAILNVCLLPLLVANVYCLIVANADNICFIGFGSSMIITFAGMIAEKNSLPRSIAFGIAIIALIPTFAKMGMNSFFNSLSKYEVMRAEVSNDGKSIVQLINVDLGASGSNVTVRINDTTDTKSCLFCEFSAIPSEQVIVDKINTFVPDFDIKNYFDAFMINWNNDNSVTITNDNLDIIVK